MSGGLAGLDADHDLGRLERLGLLFLADAGAGDEGGGRRTQVQQVAVLALVRVVVIGGGERGERGALARRALAVEQLDLRLLLRVLAEHARLPTRTFLGAPVGRRPNVQHHFLVAPAGQRAPVSVGLRRKLRRESKTLYR